MTNRKREKYFESENIHLTDFSAFQFLHIENIYIGERPEKNMILYFESRSAISVKETEPQIWVFGSLSLFILSLSPSLLWWIHLTVADILQVSGS